MATSNFSGGDIADLRQRLGLTQDELAERVGVQRTSVSHWELGIRNPSGAAAILLEQLRSQAAKKKIRGR